uniref:DNA-directed RNA polymerase subunit alpha n=2 Tax=Roya TaxID=43942 RepID=A0A024B3E7_9VIRI|nr:alpha subunit of RNA polymerase [Roya anglica]YP_009256883.1 alpha subunit of RNA polymerase [Roya obtusa]AHZ11104.1 alpha subunit of RNA polymerase [Roya anglica]ANI25973.1 alpha subunit of RNA polymerase [Roya obtusa]
MEQSNSVTLIRPKWRCVEDNPEENRRLHYSRFVLSPLLLGQAMTIGVSIRRALLSEVQGVCITSVAILNASHEYCSLEGVKESVDEILMNLKQIVFKGSIFKAENASLLVQGPGIVTAKHIHLSSSIAVVDSDQHIATLTKNISFSLELVLEEGNCEKLKEKKQDQNSWFEIYGHIPPVQKINYSVHPLGKFQTRQELLFLEIWTNKSLTPQRALYEASYNLLNLFNEIFPVSTSDNLSNKQLHIDQEEISNNYNDSEELLTVFDASISNLFPSNNNLENEFDRKNLSIDQLKLSPRISNSLKKANIYTISDLLKYNQNDLLKIKNFGKKSVEQVLLALEQHLNLQLD